MKCENKNLLWSKTDDVITLNFNDTAIKIVMKWKFSE